MKKGLGLAILVTLLVIMTVLPASAGWSWCSADPHIKLPNQRGVINLKVFVPLEYRDAEVVLEVWAPEGSRLVGGSGSLDITTVLHAGSDQELKVQVLNGVPAMLEPKLRGHDLGLEIVNGPDDDGEPENDDPEAVWTLP
jgi:hypothetical protein